MSNTLFSYFRVRIMHCILTLSIAFFLALTGLQATENVLNVSKITNFHNLFLRKRDSSNSDHCQKGCRGRRGHRGQTGAIGPVGPSGHLAVSSISAYNLTDQSFPTDNSINSIDFTLELASPEGINHTGSTFQVQNEGVYLIGWTLTSFIPDFVAGGGILLNVNIFLHNVTTNTDIPPTPMLTYSQGPTKEQSGQTIVRLPKDDVVQLRVRVIAVSPEPPPNIVISNPTFFITQIAP